MARRRYKVNRPGAVWRLAIVLLLLATTAMVLPESITSQAGNILQVLGPFQAAVGSAVDSTKRVTSQNPRSDRAERRAAALQSLVTTLAAQNRALRLENQSLTAVRGRGLAARGRLVPARVVGDDPLAWRASRTLLAGTRRGVSHGEAVISDYFTVDAADPNGIESGMAVLSSETLVGVIARVGAYTSQVQLLSDPQTRMSVTVGRVNNGVFTSANAAFWLVGRGRGRIEIREVHHRYIDDGKIKIGDSVLTLPDDPVLPPSVSIGIVTAITPDEGNRLLYTLRVDPQVNPDDLRRVYVVDADR